MNRSSVVRNYDFEEEKRIITRLKRFAPLSAAIAALLALMVVPIPVAAAHMSATSNATDTERSLHMKCEAGPCAALGINAGPDGTVGWHGYWIVLGKNLPGSARAVVTVTLPNGQPYPDGQYSNGGTLYGFFGNVGHTDPFGSPYWIVWAGYNGENALTDPPGKYTLTIHFGPLDTDAVTTTFRQADHF